MTEISLDAKGQQRLEVLARWAAEAAVSGHEVPEQVELAAIAHTKIVAVEGPGQQLSKSGKQPSAGS
ncbi:hypothetical protein [Arthrobacter psychrolactophilus]